MPEEPRRDGSPRPPHGTERGHLRGIRPVAEALDLGDGRLEGHVAGRPDVGAPEDHQAGRSSRSTGRCPGIAWSASWTASSSRRGERVEIECSRLDRLGERAAVARLLAAEPDGQQLGVGQGEEAGRCQRVGGHAKPVECRTRGGQRDLLLEDDVEQGREARLAIPQRWRAVAGDDPGEVRVARGQLLDGRQQAFSGQRLVGEGRRRRATTATAPRSPKPPAGSGSNGRPSAPRSHARAFSPSDGRW